VGKDDNKRRDAGRKSPNRAFRRRGFQSQVPRRRSSTRRRSTSAYRARSTHATRIGSNTHESLIRWLEDVASNFAGMRVGWQATLLLFTLASAALALIFVTAFVYHP